MDTSVHQSLYEQGLEMRKKVVGEDYVANALEKGSGDFMRPLQQFATVSLSFSLSTPCFSPLLFPSYAGLTYSITSKFDLC